MSCFTLFVVGFVLGVIAQETRTLVHNLRRIDREYAQKIQRLDRKLDESLRQDAFREQMRQGVIVPKYPEDN